MSETTGCPDIGPQGQSYSSTRSERISGRAQVLPARLITARHVHWRVKRWTMRSTAAILCTSGARLFRTAKQAQIAAPS